MVRSNPMVRFLLNEPKPWPLAHRVGDTVKRVTWYRWQFLGVGDKTKVMKPVDNLSCQRQNYSNQNPKFVTNIKNVIFLAPSLPTLLIRTGQVLAVKTSHFVPFRPMSLGYKDTLGKKPKFLVSSLFLLS